MAKDSLRLHEQRAAALHSRALRGAVLVALLCSTTCGCLRAITDKPLDVTKAAESDDAQAAEPQAEPEVEVSLEEVEQTLTTKVTRPDIATKIPTTQVVDGWYRLLSTEETWISTPGKYRWHHDGLASVMKSEGAHEKQLQTASKSKEKFVRAAALIGLARMQPTRSAKPLVALARDANLPLSTRRAAVETLASSRVAETEAELRTLEGQFGATERGLYAEPLLYAEVLAGLARHVAVDQDPLFTLALTAPDTDVQLAALSLWGNAKGQQLPEEVESLAKSPQARIRRAALGAMVAGEHPALIEHLASATQDADLQVRVAAIELLGKVKQHEAIILLNAQAQHDQERHREAAAVALVQQQEWAAVERTAKDTSFRVRAALAVALAPHGSRERVPLAQALLKDSSAMVQAKMGESLATWPADVAVPLLLSGLASPNMITRQAACQSLLAQQVDLAGFNPGAPPPERNAKVAALTEQWRAQHPVDTLAQQKVAAAGGALADEVARLIKQLQTPGNREAQWIARKELERLGSAILPVLDELTADRRVTIDEATYRDLLGAVSPAFQAIEKLRTADVSQRRTAARQLANEAHHQPLSRLAIDRMSAVAKAETDSLVWSDMLRAASHSPTVTAHELAMSALTHSEADVRRRACEYLSTCGDKRQAEALAQLIDDRDPVVAKQAVAALGKCGLPASRAGLYALLGRSDAHMQVAAAQTLARWQDQRGSAALERMATSAAPGTRRLAIDAMAELADARFVDVLVQALDDQASVQLAALNALPKAAGEDPIQLANPAPVSAGDKARVWQAWYAERR